MSTAPRIASPRRPPARCARRRPSPPGSRSRSSAWRSRTAVAITSRVASSPAAPSAATLRPTVQWMWKRPAPPASRCSSPGARPCGSFVMVSSSIVLPCQVVMSGWRYRGCRRGRGPQQGIVELVGALDRSGAFPRPGCRGGSKARVVDRDNVAEPVDQQRERPSSVVMNSGEGASASRAGGRARAGRCGHDWPRRLSSPLMCAGRVARGERLGQEHFLDRSTAIATTGSPPRRSRRASSSSDSSSTREGREGVLVQVRQNLRQIEHLSDAAVDDHRARDPAPGPGQAPRGGG